MRIPARTTDRRPNISCECEVKFHVFDPRVPHNTHRTIEAKRERTIIMTEETDSQNEENNTEMDSCSIVLEEEIDPNYSPSEEEVIEYAKVVTLTPLF